MLGWGFFVIFRELVLAGTTWSGVCKPLFCSALLRFAKESLYWKLVSKLLMPIVSHVATAAIAANFHGSFVQFVTIISMQAAATNNPFYF